MDIDNNIIIGAGKTTQNLIRYMNFLGKKFQDSFIMCADNDRQLWGTQLEGVLVGAVDDILRFPNANIVISSIYEKDIRRQLKQLNITNRVMDNIDYKRMLFVDFQINQYHRMHDHTAQLRQNIIFNLTVYTVIFDNYDLLQEVECCEKSIKYICFTDNKTLKSDTWEIHYVEREFDDPVLESRKYKILPHLFIETEYSLYIDANIRLERSPLKFVNQYFISGNWLFVPHPDRDCIYQEMAVCVLWNRDSIKRLINQTRYYNEYGCPEHVGLFCGAIIARRHFEKEVIAFENQWWNHFMRYSRRDQISLGYLIWKNNIDISLANIDFYNNEWFTVNKIHKKWEKDNVT